MPRVFRLLPLVVTAAAAATGCIHTKETTYKDVTRTPVEFETETAGRLFYEALSKRPHGGSRTESSSKVSLPLVFSNEHRVVRGPNAAFNEAVAACDTNKDGRITETEARIFADRH
jgi:hypothetical protein